MPTCVRRGELNSVVRSRSSVRQERPLEDLPGVFELRGIGLRSRSVDTPELTPHRRSKCQARIVNASPDVGELTRSITTAGSSLRSELAYSVRETPASLHDPVGRNQSNLLVYQRQFVGYILEPLRGVTR